MTHWWLQTKSGKATNNEFRMTGYKMTKYTQNKLQLSEYYGKFIVQNNKTRLSPHSLQ